MHHIPICRICSICMWKSGKENWSPDENSEELAGTQDRYLPRVQLSLRHLTSLDGGRRFEARPLHNHCPRIRWKSEHLWPQRLDAWHRCEMLCPCKQRGISCDREFQDIILIWEFDIIRPLCAHHLYQTWYGHQPKSRFVNCKTSKASQGGPRTCRSFAPLPVLQDVSLTETCQQGVSQRCLSRMKQPPKTKKILTMTCWSQLEATSLLCRKVLRWGSFLQKILKTFSRHCSRAVTKCCW